MVVVELAHGNKQAEDTKSCGIGRNKKIFSPVMYADISYWGTYDYLAIAIVFFLIIISEIKWKKGKTKYLGLDDVPGPTSLPLIGTRWIYYFRYKLNKIHEAQSDLFLRYGPIFKEESIWNVPIVNVVTRFDVEKVLRDTSKFPIRPPTEVISYYRKSRPDRYTNLGLVNESGEIWHSLRTALTHELTSSRTISRYRDTMAQVTAELITLLKSSRDSDGVVVGFDELSCRFGLESICSLVLGRRMGFLEVGGAKEKAIELEKAVESQFLASRDSFFGLPIWKLIGTKSYKQLTKSEDRIYDLISEMVDEALAIERDSYNESESVFMSILKAKGVDLRDRKAAIIDFIAAGIKTLGNSLSFIVYLVGRNKDEQDKIYESEPGDNSRLKATVTESFRLLPTAPCLARITSDDLELNGYRIPRGTVVLCHTWLASLMEENFEKASEFIPERWLQGVETSKSNLVLPFGTGKRICPGKKFVESQLQITLEMLIREFEIESTSEIEVEFEYLLSPKSPLSVKLTERK